MQTTVAPPPVVDDRVRALVDAADALLTEGGLEGLTIRAVLERTGFARRAFYECFAGKDDLVLAVFARTLRQAADISREAAPGDPLVRLEGLVFTIVMGEAAHDAGAQAERRSAALSREHLRLAESRPDELRAALRPLLDLIAELLAEGMAAGSVRRADPQRLAGFLYNLVSTTVQAELMAEEGRAADAQARARLSADLWAFCHRAIAA